MIGAARRARRPFPRNAVLTGLALGCVAISSPAHAQKVALLTFDLPAPDEPGGITPEELARDFYLLAPAATSQLEGSRAAAIVPAWMRPGAPSPFGTLSGPVSSATCAALPYRPRRDLPLATEARRARLYPVMAQAACEAGLPVGLFDALVVQESRYNPAAVSPKGAIGLAQLMPGTARYLSVADPFDALSNLRGGARYLREQLTAFGRVDLALAAYNAGPGRVRARWAVPRISETQGYVSSVTRGWEMSVAREVGLLDFRQEAPALPSPRPFAGRAAHVVLFPDID